MKLLIIEDEPDLRDLLRQSLEKEAYLVEVVADFEGALDKIVSFEYDCILLDIMLPDGSGLELLPHIKKQQPAGNVIIISAKDSTQDKITGLNLGADDYLAKPFHIAELTARVKSVLRRRMPSGSDLLTVGNVTLNLSERMAYVRQVAMELNRKEFDILSYFMMNTGRLVNKTALAEKVWGDYIEQADDFAFLYSQIKNLRGKLDALQADVVISAVYGVGYKLLTQ